MTFMEPVLALIITITLTITITITVTVIITSMTIKACVGRRARP